MTTFLLALVLAAGPARASGMWCAVEDAGCSDWAKRVAGMEWKWRRAGALGMGLQRSWPRNAPPPKVTRKRLLAWLPGMKEGYRHVYELTFEDGRQKRVIDAALDYSSKNPPYEGNSPLAGLSAQAMAMEQWGDDAACKKTQRDKGGPPIIQEGSNERRKLIVQVLDCDPLKPWGERRTYLEKIVVDGKVLVQEVYHASPLIFDLDGSGPQAVAKNTLFDLEGRGRKADVQWINDLAPRTALLVFDADGDGKPGEDGREIFGDRTDLGDGRRFANGFEALVGLVELAVRRGKLPEIVLTEMKLEPWDLAALEKSYGLKARVGGFNAKAVSLSKAGILGIALSRSPVEVLTDFDGMGNDLALQLGAVFLRSNGSISPYADIWLRMRAPERMATR